MRETRPFSDLRDDMGRRRLTACGHDLHIFKQGTRWGVCIVPETGDVFGAPCEKAGRDDQPGDTLGADWREHWRRRHATQRDYDADDRPEGSSEQPLHD